MIPVETSYFNLVDCGIIGVCLLFVAFGYVRGITKEVLSLCSWSIATVISFAGTNYVSTLFDDMIKIPIIRQAVSFILLFVVSLMFFLLLTAMAAEKVAQTRFCDANKALGGIFGIIKAFIIVLVAMIITLVFAPKGSVMDSVNASKIGPYIKDVAIDCCVSLKTYLKSEDFRELCRYFDKDVPTIEPANQTEEMKKLAVPQISQAVYDKEAEYNKRREKFIRRQTALGQAPVQTQKEETAPANEPEKKAKPKITKETLNKLAQE